MTRVRVGITSFVTFLAASVSASCSATHARTGASLSSARTSETSAFALVRSYVRAWRLEVITARRQVPEFSRPVLPLGASGRALGSIFDQLEEARVPCFGGPQSEGDYNQRFDVRVRDRVAQTRLLGTTEPGYCPFWDWSTPAGPFADGTGAISSRLPPVAQDRLNALREGLLRGLDSLLRASPRDSIALGQRVRFSITPTHIAEAMPAVESCTLSAAYCLQLRARLEARLGHLLVADSLYRAARTILDASRQCRADGLAWVWPAIDERNANAACADYVRLRETLWWLANPRWSEPENLRLLAHENRRFDVLVRQQVGLDEYLDFAPKQRATAVALLMRYGFPVRVFAREVGADTSYIRFVPHDGDEHYRFIGAPSYSIGSYRTIPDPVALQSPFDAPLAAFSVRAPPGTFDVAAEFPFELIETDLQLHDLQSAQLAHFVRDSLLVLAVAVPQPPPSLAVRTGGMLRSAFMSSTGPGVVEQISANTMPASSPVRMLGLTQMSPSVLSIEVEPFGGPAADVWRARFGQRPSPTLTAAVGGAAAMSDVMLVEAGGDTLGPGVPLETMYRRMLSSSVVPTGQARLGLFWELYGLREGGTIRYQVSVTSNRGPSFMAQVFSLTRGEARQSGNSVSIALSKRVETNFATRTQRGALVVSDGLVLNLRGLPEGEYTLQVSASSEAAASSGAGGVAPFTAQSSRVIRIQGP